MEQILQQYGLKVSFLQWVQRGRTRISQWNQSTEITPVAYVDYVPFPFNNYIYKVNLAAPAVPGSFPCNQPCISLPPAEGVSTPIFRLSNPLAQGLNNANRVENDVIAQYLVQNSLEDRGLDSVVPAVYAWMPCKYPKIPNETGFGWAISEFKTGTDLDGQFPSLSLEDGKNALEQIADILTTIQRVKLFSGVTNFGALTLSDRGVIVSGQMPLLKGGP